MNKTDIVNAVKEQNFDNGSYVVFGSCPMAAAGIRESSDIDMLVSEQLFTKLQKRGWKVANKGHKDNPLVLDDFEAHKSWELSSYNPSLKQLMSKANYIEGIPFASLEDVKKWKLASGRPKDIRDVKLIDSYLQEN